MSSIFAKTYEKGKQVHEWLGIRIYNLYPKSAKKLAISGQNSEALDITQKLGDCTMLWIAWL